MPGPSAAGRHRGVDLPFGNIAADQFLGLRLPVVAVALQVCDPLIPALELRLQHGDADQVFVGGWHLLTVNVDSFDSGNVRAGRVANVVGIPWRLAPGM